MRLAANVAKLAELLQRRSNKAVLTVVGAVYGGVNLSWRRLGGAYVMEAFLIVLAVIAGTDLLCPIAGEWHRISLLHAIRI